MTKSANYLNEFDRYSSDLNACNYSNNYQNYRDTCPLMNNNNDENQCKPVNIEIEHGTNECQEIRCCQDLFLFGDITNQQQQQENSIDFFNDESNSLFNDLQININDEEQNNHQVDFYEDFNEGQKKLNQYNYSMHNGYKQLIFNFNNEKSNDLSFDTLGREHLMENMENENEDLDNNDNYPCQFRMMREEDPLVIPTEMNDIETNYEENVRENNTSDKNNNNNNNNVINFLNSTQDNSVEIYQQHSYPDQNICNVARGNHQQTAQTIGDQLFSFDLPFIDTQQYSPYVGNDQKFLDKEMKDFIQNQQENSIKQEHSIKKLGKTKKTKFKALSLKNIKINFYTGLKQFIKFQLKLLKKRVSNHSIDILNHEKDLKELVKFVRKNEKLFRSFNGWRNM